VVVGNFVVQYANAIANYNDNAPSNDDRWYIGVTTLSQVSGATGRQ